MPMPALSLLGFMSQAEAIDYMNRECHITGDTQRTIRTAWERAKTKLGDAMPKAGHPEFLEIPPEFQDYLDGVQKNPRIMEFQGVTWSFKLVEIEPLLAFQKHVFSERSESLCQPLNEEPNIGEALKVCLPHTTEEIDIDVTPLQGDPSKGGMVITSKNANVRVMNNGQFVDKDGRLIPIADLNWFILGIPIGPTNPLAQVATLNGFSYLRNGYHRACGLRRAGLTHMPCVAIEVRNFEEVVGPQGRGFFPRSLLESNCPPTVAHYTQGRAYPVSLRDKKRTIKLTWTESFG